MFLSTWPGHTTNEGGLIPWLFLISIDEDFLAFVEAFQAEVERLPSAETYLEELEAKLSEKEGKQTEWSGLYFFCVMFFLYFPITFKYCYSYTLS